MGIQGVEFGGLVVDFQLQGLGIHAVDKVFIVCPLQVEQGRTEIAAGISYAGEMETEGGLAVLAFQGRSVAVDKCLGPMHLLQPYGHPHDIIVGEAREDAILQQQSTVEGFVVQAEGLAIPGEFAGFVTFFHPEIDGQQVQGPQFVRRKLIRSTGQRCAEADKVGFRRRVGQEAAGVEIQGDGRHPQQVLRLHVAENRLQQTNNAYTVHYCNDSPAAAPDAYILLTLDPLLSIVSSPRPYIDLGNHVFQFNLGQVAPFECSQFSLQVQVSCEATLGQTHCSEAHIFPDTSCVSSNPLWSGAEVGVRSECTGDSLHFILKNTGSGPMANTLDYIVIEDGIMGLEGVAAPLAAGDSMLVSVPANGSTWRIEAQQAAYFPGQSIPVLSVEGCRSSGPFSTGYVQQFATNDADPFIDVDCTANIGSYDPNDKQGLPLGYGAAHYIRPGTDLEYLIRFQNTGTDTAFTVIVRDTLAPWLDPVTVRPGGSSHDYTFGITGDGVLVFDFQNILLPDSNVNEAASHGFLKFRVSQRAEVPLETDILNRAAIYFDFNDPVLTNTTMHRVGENFLLALWQPERPVYHVGIAPHPLRDASWLAVQGGPEQGDYRLRLYDATGRPVQTLRSASPQFRVEKAGLPGGVYLFRVELDGGLVGRGILVAQ